LFVVVMFASARYVTLLLLLIRCGGTPAFCLKKIESYCLPASKQTHRHTSYLNNSIVVQYKGISILETAEE
jgi:hypothetical protein